MNVKHIYHCMQGFWFNDSFPPNHAQSSSNSIRDIVHLPLCCPPVRGEDHVNRGENTTEQ